MNLLDQRVARAQAATECVDPNETTPESFGPTDISAVSGNQRLSVAVNDEATVTVFKWPSPSYYDQIKYRTSDRSRDRLGALPNEGAFIGIAWRHHPRDDDQPDWRFSWLRDWRSTQRFSDDDSDEVVTSFSKRRVGLTVQVKDLVTASHDTLLRHVKVSRSRRSTVRAVRVVAFANYNPVVSKIRRAPVADWCTEERNDNGASYLEEQDLVVHERMGVDESTGAQQSVALAVGFGSRSEGHHVGPDTYEAAAAGASAYDDASDGELSGGGQVAGQADAALFDQLDLRRERRRSATIVMSAGASLEQVTANVTVARATPYRAARSEKKSWWRAWLEPTVLPQNAPTAVTRLAKRSLISIRQATDASSGLIVTSIATQSPLGTDTVRHGAYINHALDVAGHPEMVEKHNLRYGSLQATAFSKPPGGEATPPGNWAQSYYADGVVAGPVPYEIDSTGLGIWTLWDHYTMTGDLEYLNSGPIYGAIQRAAHYLTDDAPVGCRDPATGLQCSAPEEDSASPTRTLRGAQAAWLGLSAAVNAATVRATPEALANAEVWKARRDELAAAIEANFFDEQCSCYTQNHEVGGTLLWPVRFPMTPAVADAQAVANWTHVGSSIEGETVRGGLESRAILGNSYVWRDAADVRRLKAGLEWVARTPTTDGTGLLGGAWMVYPSEAGSITTMLSQPHVWNHAMFYLAAIRTYGEEGWTP